MPFVLSSVFRFSIMNLYTIAFLFHKMLCWGGGGKCECVIRYMYVNIQLQCFVHAYHPHVTVLSYRQKRFSVINYNFNYRFQFFRMQLLSSVSVYFVTRWGNYIFVIDQFELKLLWIMYIKSVQYFFLIKKDRCCFHTD